MSVSRGRYGLIRCVPIIYLACAAGPGGPDRDGPGEPCSSCHDCNAAEGNGTFAVCGNGLAEPGEACDDGNQADGDGCTAGCRASDTAYVKASAPHGNVQFGMAIALSADGSTLAVGAPFENSAATGIDGDQSDDSAAYAGAVYVFTRSATSWRQQAYLKASNTRAGAQFGTTVALSADGSTLAVGAIGESSAATGVDGDQSDRSAAMAGAVYLFTRGDAVWHQRAYLKPSNTDRDYQFGASVALTADGSRLAVGAIGEASAAVGIDGNQADRSMRSSGAVYVFAQAGGTWQQQAYVKASNTGGGDSFGASVALSTDGTTLAVGAATEDSAATGVDGDQADNSEIASGAVYVFIDAAGWT